MWNSNDNKEKKTIAEWRAENSKGKVGDVITINGVKFVAPFDYVLVMTPHTSSNTKDWEKEFDNEFVIYGENGEYHDNRRKAIKSFIRSLLQKSSLKGERNRYEMKQEARRELIEELEGKVKKLEEEYKAIYEEWQKGVIKDAGFKEYNGFFFGESKEQGVFNNVLFLLSSYKDQ